VNPYQLSAPSWLDTERFDITAKIPDGATQGQVPLMLQNLLADRFQLAIHRESKDMSFYSLAIGKNGLKTPKAAIEEKDCVEDPTGDQVRCHQFNGGQGRGLHGQAVTMQDLAEFIENWTDHPVVDKTGIQGFFAIESEGWVPMRQPPPQAAPATPPSAAPAPIGPPRGDGDMADPTRPTLFTVLGRLGLELRLGKGPIDIFVVDHIERPAAN